MQNDDEQHEQALAAALAQLTTPPDPSHSTPPLLTRRRLPPEPDPYAPGPDARRPTRRLLPYVCARAWAQLIVNARAHSYVLEDAKRPQGMSPFIVHTIMAPNQIWSDTRPDYLREMDPHRAQRNLPPLYADSDHCIDRRMPRVVKASMLDLDVLDRVVTDLEMATGLNVNYVALKSPHMQLGALLEAWGQGNLTPTVTPMRPPHHRLAIPPRNQPFTW